MARLLKTPYPMPEIDYDNFNYKTDPHYVAFEKVCAEREVVKFPRGDGYAFYLIVSKKPLVLQHIPYGDAWQIDPAHMRGLRLYDIETIQEHERTLDKLFAKKGAKA